MSSSRRVRRRPKRELGKTSARVPATAPADEAATADVEGDLADAEPQLAEAEPEPVAEAEADGFAELNPDATVAADAANDAVATAEVANASFTTAEPTDAAAEPEPTEPEPEPEPEAEPEPEPEAKAEAEPEPVAEAVPEPEPEPKAEVVVAPEQRRGMPELEEFDPDDDVRSWVRPYVWTGGRTSTSLEFALETLVSARAAKGADETMRHEHQQVLQLCEQPRSVSEIAALLSVPLGAAKALLGVMAEEDLLVVHQSSGSAGPDLELMERVLRGLRKL